MGLNSRKGFSLIEVALALGIVTIALVGLVGMLPVGLGINHRSVFETRAGHIAHLVFAELRTPPSSGSGPNHAFGRTFDLAALDNNDINSAEHLYVEYESLSRSGSGGHEGPAITAQRTPDSVYDILLLFNNAPSLPGVPSNTTGLANQVTLIIRPLTAKAEDIRFASIIANLR